MLASAKWQNVSWRNGTKGRLEARLAAVRVRTADGPPQRISRTNPVLQYSRKPAGVHARSVERHAK
jgi:hypothetical protein